CNKCTSDLTVPQFRVLAYLNYHKGASLSAVAEHLELSLPSMSKTIDCLVKRNLVAREISSNDRRRITLELTTAGIKAFETIREDTRKHFSEMLSTLSEEDREKIVQAMHMLQAILKPSEKSSSRP
ncbi:MAG TPA: MarR family transcriptional regulator, partial [Armatimonadota bacterium]|nr:MarR family transcriptional regulator [Armatimonadota bacterium]